MMAHIMEDDSRFRSGDSPCLELDASRTAAILQVLQIGSCPNTTVSLASIYEPLSPGEIRVLELFQQDSTDIPACRLPSATTGDTSYSALSHTWLETEYCWYGKRLPSKTSLRINDQVVMVKAHVVLMLSIAYVMGLGRIWIDVLCINQEDEVERGHQVASMGLIFSQCHEVLVFLGKPSGATDQLLRDLIEYGLYPDDESRHVGYYWLFNFGYHQLIEHEYWYRAWVLQEVGLAQARRIVCGNMVLNHSRSGDLFKVLAGSDRQHQGRESYMGTFLNVTTVWNDRHFLQKFTGSSTNRYPELLHLLGATRQAQCSDKLDAIYAKMHLAKDGHIIGNPNYLQTPEELYLHLAKQHIRTSNSLTILEFIPLTGGSTLLPSWVPD